MKRELIILIIISLVGCKSASLKDGASISVNPTNAERGLLDCFVLYSDLLDITEKDDPSSEDVSRFKENIAALGGASNFTLKDNGRTQDQIKEIFKSSAKYVWLAKKEQDSYTKLYNDCETIVLPSAKRMNEVISKAKKVN